MLTSVRLSMCVPHGSPMVFGSGAHGVSRPYVQGSAGHLHVITEHLRSQDKIANSTVRVGVAMNFNIFKSGSLCCSARVLAALMPSADMHGAVQSRMGQKSLTLNSSSMQT